MAHQSKVADLNGLKGHCLIYTDIVKTVVKTDDLLPFTTFVRVVKLTAYGRKVYNELVKISNDYANKQIDRLKKIGEGLYKPFLFLYFGCLPCRQLL